MFIKLPSAVLVGLCEFPPSPGALHSPHILNHTTPHCSLCFQ
jgi:hypothetical protein